MKKTTITSTILFLLFLIIVCACQQGPSSLHLQSKLDSLQNELDIRTKADSTEEANKKLVADFYQDVFGDKNVATLDQYLAEGYIQHNPALADGRETLRQALTTWFKGLPKEKIEVHHLSAEGNLVYIHTKSTETGKVVSIIDIFRIEDSKIAEHWDVIQPVPEKSANPHPMF